MRSKKITDISAFEDQSWEELTKLAEVDRDDIFKQNPLFYWYLKKQDEMRVVKIILMGKKFGFTRERIRETLGGLYARF